jgi:acylphosphatase
MTTRRFIVSGRVQGVGFRWFVLQHARRLELGGFARNCLDGTVEIVASGGAEGLEQLRQRLHEGPPGARVAELVEFEADDTGFEGFEMRRT